MAEGYSLDKFRIFNEYGEAERMLVKRPQEAMETQYLIDRRWKQEGWTGRPEFNRAAEQHYNITRTLKHRELAVSWMGGEDVVSIDSIYVRDTVLMTPAGMVTCLLTKTSRLGEAEETAEYLDQLGVPLVGAVQYPGIMNGSDALWFNSTNLIVAQTDETNSEAIQQLTDMFAAHPILNKVKIHSFDLRDINGEREGAGQGGAAQGGQGGAAQGGQGGATEGGPRYRVRGRLNSALSFLSEKWAILCPQRLPESLLQLLRSLDCQYIECSLEEWNNFSCEVFMLLPHKGFMADEPGAQAIADKIKEKCNIYVRLLKMPDLLLGRAGLAGMICPFLRSN